MIYASRFSLLLILLHLTGCRDSATTQEDEKTDARALILQSIQAHDADRLGNALMDFTFRDVRYSVDRKQGVFQYARKGSVDSVVFEDRLTNDAFTRSENGLELEGDSLGKYKSSLNSVVYFAQLPYGLDAPAVQHSYLGEEEIKSATYHKIMVTFDENGGGEDHEDVFLYWIDKRDMLIDYLAYSYCEEDCGYRFRESVNRRKINGVTIQDYINYTPEAELDTITRIDEYYRKGKMEKVSDIKTEDVQIKLYSNDY